MNTVTSTTQMKMLSATDAIGPAFKRAREVLFTPFRLGFFLKIALVAALTQPSFYSVMFSYPMQGAQVAAGMAMPHPGQQNFAASWLGGAGASAAMFAVFAVMLLIGLIVWVAFTYLFCRLRFTLFDLIVYKQRKVREAWSKYARQTWRYFGVMILASLAFLVLMAVTIGPFFVRMLGTIKGIALQGPNPNPWPIFAQMLPLIGIVLLLGLLWVVVDTVLQDFVLPPMAIEDSPIESALSRFFGLLRAEPGSFVAYLLLRFVLVIGLSSAMFMVVALALLVIGLGEFLVGALLYRAMWHGGTGMQVVFVMIVVAMALLLLALYLVSLVAVYGTMAVIKQSYAAYYFGSRYTELGDRLEPPPDEDLVAVRVEPPLPPLPPLEEPPTVW